MQHAGIISPGATAGPSGAARRGPRLWLGFGLGFGLGLALAAGAGCGADRLDIERCPGRLLPGQLVITEVMPTPTGADVSDDPGDDGRPGPAWIEIYNPTDVVIGLQGVRLLTRRSDGSAAGALVLTPAQVEPGRYFVLGRSARSATAPAWLDLDLPAMPTIDPGGGSVTLACDVIEIDTAAYPANPPGAAVGLSGGGQQPDPERNDDPAGWCSATIGFAPGARGSPGAANEACPGAPGGGGDDDRPSPDGMCTDADGLRPIDGATPGDVVITEIMPNPDAVSDADGEWAEVYVDRDLDLNGLSLGRSSDSLAVVVNTGECVRARAGAYVLFAASADSAVNGGLAPVAGELPTSLVNANGGLVLGAGTDIVLDQVTWTSSSAGASLSLDPSARSPVDNDLAAPWCVHRSSSYGSGDTGTPGAANASCADPGGGGAAPDAGLEPRDGGLDLGPDALDEAAPIDAPPADHCRDGEVLRPIARPGPGAVHITELMANPDAVSDADGEWFELRIDVDADLNGLELGRTPGEVLTTLTSEHCLRVSAGAYAVLAHGPDPAQNGGLPEVVGGFEFSLVNAGGGLFVGAEGVVFDAVNYAVAAPGATWMRSSSGDELWCECPPELVYGLGDRGTPAAANPTCP
ncbi:hypothetical protein [Haliangium sp.]|uniref:hypothetical protein n=1 Tax=Haliangium sp. TaxID=2663208 RepID=UPI003D0D7FD5